MDTLLIFFLNRSFLNLVEKNQKPGFLNQRALLFLFINLKLRTKFWIYRLLVSDSDWLNFIHFSGYKDKIRLVKILRKREDQALISISTKVFSSDYIAKQNKFLKKIFFFSRFLVINLELDICLVKYKSRLTIRSLPILIISLKNYLWRRVFEQELCSSLLLLRLYLREGY